MVPVMGHADERMLNRVYGKISAVDLAPLMTGQILAATPVPTAVSTCPDDANTNDLRGRYVVGSSGETGSQGRSCQGRTPRKPREFVPRDGIEPPTRGFSIPCSTN